MITGTTKSGFQFEFDERAAADIRANDMLATILRKDADLSAQLVALSDYLNFVLGAEQKARLFDHIAAYSDGFVPSGAVGNELKDILATPKTKN